MSDHFPFEFIWFGAKDGDFTYEFIGFGAMDDSLPYEFIGFEAMCQLNGSLWVKPYEHHIP